MRGPSSWQVAKSTFMFLARTETWDSTSGASGVSTATVPSGISSSPVTRSMTRMVGSSYTSSWILYRSCSTLTMPADPPGLITCQALSSAADLSPASMLPSTWLTAKAGPPRTTSSAKSSLAHSSTPKALPRAVEMGSMRAETESLMSARAMRVRSTTAAACRACSLVGTRPLLSSAGSPSHAARQKHISSLSPAVRHRFWSRGPTSLMAARGWEPAARSAPPRITSSSARSK
mmetsp:Transcript_13402/g.38051  ORF Transcript_13402/g.38051 Transcript_13402/m.38051 type:complete len:233 (+) Transcript_13402:1430-2128(+)